MHPALPKGAPLQGGDGAPRARREERAPGHGDRPPPSGAPAVTSHGRGPRAGEDAAGCRGAAGPGCARGGPRRRRDRARGVRLSELRGRLPAPLHLLPARPPGAGPRAEKAGAPRPAPPRPRSSRGPPGGASAASPTDPGPDPGPDPEGGQRAGAPLRVSGRAGGPGRRGPLLPSRGRSVRARPRGPGRAPREPGAGQGAPSPRPRAPPPPRPHRRTDRFPPARSAAPPGPPRRPEP
ncbi:basic salivary proline-rich protein 1-like [Canis lupus dingo]|uniref:basic salivary proline-rich protein 1-like n=1 Tax=Canis lupus dingo TaxID=286419 RepID=UPI0020C2D1EA|nr:basic salivary proline-rich protein 1-like [Canis lupus dingo]